MNTTALLIGLGPLLGWGLYPTVASKIGGKPVNQILGSTIGTLFFAFIYFLMVDVEFPMGKDLFYAILSGIGWASAQIITFKSFNLIGSSKAMPITTAFQILGASLWGVFALGEWGGIQAKLYGAFALALIILGASLTVWTENSDKTNNDKLKRAVLLLAIGEIGYWAYSAAPQATDIDGKTAFLPQAIGMVVVAVLYSLFVTFKDREIISPFLEKVSYQHIFSGLFFAFAALTYLISAQENMNGLSKGFVLSQTSVILATLTGIWFLNQKKTRKELYVTILGLVLIIAAATITAFL